LKVKICIITNLTYNLHFNENFVTIVGSCNIANMSRKAASMQLQQLLPTHLIAAPVPCLR
jgi:hypothetical protein